jgi:hypothetical protein
MVLNLPLDECIHNNTFGNPREKEKGKEANKRNSNKRSNAEERQRARSLEEEQSRTP